MGLRVHVIKKHQKYGSFEAFNWNYLEFRHLLDSLCCDVCAEDEFSREFECEEDAYKNALKVLKVYKKKGCCKEVRDILGEMDYSVDELEHDLDTLGGIDNVLKAMETFWKERDKACRWISFSAW